MFKHIALEFSTDHHIAMLLLNQQTNVINADVIYELCVALDEVNKNTFVRVMIIDSNSQHSGFGADLNELVIKPEEDSYMSMTASAATEHVMDGREVVKKLFYLRVPIIGIAKGYCLGGSAELLAFCDILLGASREDDADGLIYGFPEVTIGCMPGWMGPEILAKKIGAGDLYHLLFTGRKITGDEALKMGIVHELHPRAMLLKRAMELAEQIAANAPLAVESTRCAINHGLFPDFDDVLSSSVETINNLTTKDFLKSITAMFTKSKTPVEFFRE